MSTKLFVSAALLCSLIGCGGSSPSNSSSSSPSITGDWGFTATSSVIANTTALVGVYLTQSGNSVSGIAHIESNCFGSGGVPIPVTGSVNASGTLTVVSTAVGGQVFTAGGNVSSGTSISGGTYSVTGGCAGGDQGTLTGGLVQPLSGTYTGSFQTTGGATGTVSFPVTQTSTVDSSGFFHLSGTATFTGSPCLTQATIVDASTDTEVIGKGFLLRLTVPSSSTQVLVSGSQSLDGKTVSAVYSIVGGPCAYDEGFLSLTN